MSSLWGHFVGVIILLLMAIFIGIWIWAWLPRHRAVFDRLANLPMQDQHATGKVPEAEEQDEEENS